MFWQNLYLKLRYVGGPYLRALLLLALGVAALNAGLFHYLPRFEPPYWLWTVAGPLVLAALVVWRLWQPLPSFGR